VWVFEREDDDETDRTVVAGLVVGGGVVVVVVVVIVIVVAGGVWDNVQDKVRVATRFEMCFGFVLVAYLCAVCGVAEDIYVCVPCVV